MIVEFSDNIAVEHFGKRCSKGGALISRRQFKKIGNIRRVKRRDKLSRALYIACIYPVENLPHERCL